MQSIKKRILNYFRGGLLVSLAFFLGISLQVACRTPVHWQQKMKLASHYTLSDAINLSRIYYLQNRKQDIQKLYYKLVHTHYNLGPRLYRIADLLYRTGRAEEGFALMENLASKEANCPQSSEKKRSNKQKCKVQALLWLGEYYLAEPDYTLAHYYYNEALAIQPQHIQILWGLGCIAWHTQKWQDTVEILAKLKPHLNSSYMQGQRKNEYYFLLAKAYYQQEQHTLALSLIKQLKKNAHNKKTILLYGDILYKLDYRNNLHQLVKQWSIHKPHLYRELSQRWYGVLDSTGLESIQQHFSSLF